MHRVKKCEILIIESEDFHICVKSWYWFCNSKSAILSFTSLRRLAIFSSLLLNRFYLSKIIEYWNCFQMHNNSKNYRNMTTIFCRQLSLYLTWIKSLFPFYIIEYRITFMIKKMKPREEVVWHGNISFLLFCNFYSFVSI